MNRLGLLLFVAVLTACGSSNNTAERDRLAAVDRLNPLMGTDSEHDLSTGNTYPAVALPWGMNFWTPQTGEMGDGWTYTYDAKKIRGIKQTHQPSPWINDYAAFSLMAVTGDLKFDETERASWFSHKAEESKPYSYSVYLADYDVTAAVVPTERAAVFRFTFPENAHSYILLDAFDQGSKVVIIPAERKIVGYCRNNHGGVPENFYNYFVAEFDADFDFTHTWKDGKLTKGSHEAMGDHVGAIVGFRTKKGAVVHVKVASSFVSPAQAELNLDREVGNQSFDQVKVAAKNAWERELERVEVTGGTADQLKTFYSCLYRVLLFPRKFYEVNAQGAVIHYSPYNGQVLPGYMFTDNGFWDTFRAVFPFFTLMYPDWNARIMQGLVNTYQESGWLPEWASPGHRDCMIGSNSASIIADSYLKGILGYDIQTLYEAMVKNTTGHKRGISSVGRYGASYYNALGYVPCDVKINESAARTLEYAYADFCIWKLARKLGRPQAEIDLFAKRARNFRNVFDRESGWMRGRNRDGTFQTPFNPLKWGDAFTEGNTLHYTWSVFHDVGGLIDLMGGRDKFIAALDTVFEMPPKFDASYYGTVIHEIREMQTAHMGNYAHGNQPSQHVIYLYDYAGQPWKTQSRVRMAMDKLYNPQADGYCGDEDNGQTSAWYVFSAMGFYPVCPGTGQYALGAPLFDKVTLKLENGKKFVISSADNAEKNVFVKAVKLNGKPYPFNYIEHADILKGGSLVFKMSDKPNAHRGVDKKYFPYSMRDGEK